MKRGLFASLFLRTPKVSTRPETPSYYASTPNCEKHYFVINVGLYGVKYEDYSGECSHCGADIRDWPTLNPLIDMH